MLDDVEAYLTVAPLLSLLAVIALVLLWMYRGPGAAVEAVEPALSPADPEIAPQTEARA